MGHTADLDEHDIDLVIREADAEQALDSVRGGRVADRRAAQKDGS